jgi:AraC-like DNA-binding protein
LQNEAARISTVEVGDLVEVHLNLLAGGPAVTGARGADLGVTSIFINMREVMGPSWRPAYVSFRHARPRNAEPYREVFGTEVLFDQLFDGLICTRREFERPVPGADAALTRHVEGYAEDLLAKTVRSLANQVLEVAILLLPEQRCSRERVAAALGLGVRTLQRRLSDEGATFVGLLDQARRRLADSYVMGSRRSLHEVGSLLGFASQSAFNHWHRAEYGETPSQRRKRVEQP